jgi:acyl carrier protein
MNANILNELNQILRDRGISKDPVDPGVSLLKDLSMDSLDVMDMVMEVEDRFDITISQAELANVSTLNDLALVVGDKLGN